MCVAKDGWKRRAYIMILIHALIDVLEGLIWPYIWSVIRFKLVQSLFWYNPSYPLCDDSEQTRALLTSAAYVHLKHAEVSKYMRNLAPASQTILLSGPAGFSHLGSSVFLISEWYALLL